jgi:polar amino acid transport system substrate-binding protein
MPCGLLIILMLSSVVCGQNTDPRIADLVQSGKVRVAIGLGPSISAIKDPATGEVRGPALDLGRALATRMGVALQPVEYSRPGAVLEGLRTSAWDVAFGMVLDPARAAEADFSHPYFQTDFSYVVPSGSSISKLADADQPGVRILVPRNDASDLFLTRTLKRAQLVRADSTPAAMKLLRAGEGDAYAAPRPVLVTEAAAFPGSRVLKEGFGVIYFVAYLPKGNAGRLAYINDFIEEAKASGLVKQIIQRHGLEGVQAAPTGNPSVK